MKNPLRRTILLFPFILLSLGAESKGGLEPLVSPDSKAVKLAGGFTFTEGPAATKDGLVFFTDIPNNRIHRWDSKNGKLSLFLEGFRGRQRIVPYL